jgi:hypothetical protein
MSDKKIRRLFVPGSETTNNKGWLDDEIDFKDQIFSYATLSTFLIYEEGRNTWGGVYDYKHFNSYHYDLDVIKYRIKINAKRGSHFRISTQPAIALVGDVDAIIITDYFQKNSMRARSLMSKSFSSNFIFEMAQQITGDNYTWGQGSFFTLPAANIPTFFFPPYAYPIIKGSETECIRPAARTNINLVPLFELANAINCLAGKP